MNNYDHDYVRGGPRSAARHQTRPASAYEPLHPEWRRTMMLARLMGAALLCIVAQVMWRDTLQQELPEAVRMGLLGANALLLTILGVAVAARKQ